MVEVKTRSISVKNSFVRNIDDSNYDDLVDREINRVCSQFGDYEKFERW